MKKVLIIAVLFAITTLGISPVFTKTVESKNKTYYSGDSVSYKGVFYVGTTNTGKFELFALKGNQLNKVATIQSTDRESAEFGDLLFEKANNNLYVYLVNGRYLYKYDITNPEVPTVAVKIKDNSWDWLARLEKVNGNLVTIGSKGMKIWNKDYQVINSYSMVNNMSLGSAEFAAAGNLILNLQDKLNIYSTASRQKVAEYSIASNDVRTTRVISSDSDRGLVYLVDDKSLKALDFDGNVKKELKHTSTTGYDVIDSTNPDYLYFSDGVGVVKVNKDTFKISNWSYTTSNSPVGSWAMGLSSAYDVTGEKVAVFNSSNILVLDQNLKKVAVYMSVEKETRPTEALSLITDKNRGAVNSQISIHGTGFGAGENLKIEFNKVLVSNIKTDDNGRFEVIITVPVVKGPLTADIKVTGLTSGKTYSTSFRIE
jgi:hypothetical protein